MLIVLLGACNKEKRYSEKLDKGQKWTVTDIQVDGVSLGISSTWDIHAEDIYKTVPTLDWKLIGTTEEKIEATICEWQFQEKGKKFRLNYLHQSHDMDGDQLEDLDYVAFNLTGTYDVIEHKRKRMAFESNETFFYPGQKVKIEVERIK